MNKNIKFLLLLLLFALSFSIRASAFDAQWIESYNDGKEKILALLPELEKSIGKGNLFFTAESVRELLSADTASFDRTLAKDYLRVLTTGSGYVWGHWIEDISDNADIIAIRGILANEPPYSIEFYDEAMFRLKKIVGYTALITAFFPEYITAIHHNNSIYISTDRTLDECLRESAFITFLKNFIVKSDKIVPFIAEAERKFAGAQYSFTKSDLDNINETLDKRLEVLNSGDFVHQAASYARQGEVQFIAVIRAIMTSRYEMHNDIMQKDEIREFGDYLRYTGVRIELENEIAYGIQHELPAYEEAAMKWVTSFISDFLPKLKFLVETAQAEVAAKTDWAVMLTGAWQAGKDSVFSILGTEMWSGDGYRITLRKLITVLVYLLLSMLICKWLSMLATRIFFSRLTKDAETLVRKIFFYSMLLVAVLIVFHIAEVPLTSFAFVGGALMIGIGFGTQNIFNNIISGFILATSRPFKAGDQVIFQGQRYVVVNVGERATHLWTFDDKDVFVQNKMFLEDTVTNMTYLESGRTRLNISVAAAYDADPRKVIECLLKVAQGNAKVLKSPEPFALIKNFSESSISFMLYFWIDLRCSSDIKVLGEVHLAILDEFAKNGITIPYPKLDVLIKK